MASAPSQHFFQHFKKVVIIGFALWLIMYPEIYGYMTTSGVCVIKCDKVDALDYPVVLARPEMTDQSHRVAIGFIRTYSQQAAVDKESAAGARLHWTYVTPDYLSKVFKKARDKANPYPHLEPKQQPTFHEIRALSSWVYEKKVGYSHKYVQQLMGHSTGKMTMEYQDGREIEYQEVGAELLLIGVKV